MEMREALGEEGREGTRARAQRRLLRWRGLERGDTRTARLSEGDYDEDVRMSREVRWREERRARRRWGRARTHVAFAA